MYDILYDIIYMYYIYTYIYIYYTYIYIITKSMTFSMVFDIAKELKMGCAAGSLGSSKNDMAVSKNVWNNDNYGHL